MTDGNADPTLTARRELVRRMTGELEDLVQSWLETRIEPQEIAVALGIQARRLFSATTLALAAVHPEVAGAWQLQFDEWAAAIKADIRSDVGRSLERLLN